MERDYYQYWSSFWLSTCRSPHRSIVGAVMLMLAVGLLFVLPAQAQVGAQLEPTRATQGMVVSAQKYATEAGKQVLEQGGNAIDAAVATGFALAVTHPRAGNIGGGGFMVIRFPDGEVTTIDHREKAPMAASRDMYLDEDGEIISDKRNRSHHSVGVPGTVAGLLMAHEEYGSLPLEDILAPAIRLAEEGHRISRDEARTLERFQDEFEDFESSTHYWVREEGWLAGDLLVQEDLAETLRRIRDQGRDGFYRGKTADLIVEEMERGGGFITHEDLEAYEPAVREPVVTTYRDHRIYAMGPVSSGGIALAQLLNAVEPYDVAEMGFGGSDLVHLMGEAMRRVYADRAHWPGDPDFVDFPQDELISKSYMQERMEDFDPERATPSEDIAYGTPAGYEADETTHYSAIDGEGTAVSVTTTINSFYGSKVTVGGAGFFLNNEMADFTAKPGEPDIFGLIGSEANAIEPGKRMLSSMTPIIMENPEGQPYLVTGSPGGATIITTVFQMILNIVDHGMTIEEATGAPRIHHQWQPDELRYERFGLAPDVVDRLAEKGWNMDARDSRWGRTQSILIQYEAEEVVADDAGLREERVREVGRVFLGSSDPRRTEGAAMGID